MGNRNDGERKGELELYTHKTFFISLILEIDHTTLFDSDKSFKVLLRSVYRIVHGVHICKLEKRENYFSVEVNMSLPFLLNCVKHFIGCWEARGKINEQSLSYLKRYLFLRLPAVLSNHS